MNYRKNLALAIFWLAIAIIGLILVNWKIHQSFASISTNIPASNAPNNFRVFTYFATSTNQISYATSTTATTTSDAITSYFDSNNFLDKGWFNIAGAKRVTFYFGRDASANKNTGTTTFMVDVTKDGTDWISSNILIPNTANTNSQQLIRTSNSVMTPVSMGFAASATTTFALDVSGNAFLGARCVINNQVSGNAFCSASADW